MYKHFYNLVSNPFRLAPEPDFCYVHSGYRCAREYLDFALSEGEGFVMVTGRPGTGKTMLVETFLKGINPAEVIARRIAVSSFGASDLLSAVAYAYGIDADGMNQSTMRHRIQQYFLQQERAGRRVLLIIDEAQTLSHAALEELRILADLQTRSRLMLQLFLVGQESLQELMHSPEMEQFQQRVIANYRLVPLKLKDTRSYIKHRLLQAGWDGDPEFSGEAVLSIYQLSRGIPRHINKICNRLLLLGFGKGSHLLDQEDVLEISAEMREEQLTPLEIDQALRGDSENVTSIADAREGQIAVAELAIRVDRLDNCAVAVPEVSRIAAQSGEAAFVARHNEPVTSSDIEAVAPVTITSVPTDAANTSIARVYRPERDESKHHAGHFSWPKILAATAAVLIVLMVMMATVPSFPGRDRAMDLLASSDSSSRWGKQIAAMQERLVALFNQAPAPAAGNDYPLTAGVIDRQQELTPVVTPEVMQEAVPETVPAEVPEEVVALQPLDPEPAQPAPLAPEFEQTAAAQDVSIETLLEKGKQALDDYRLVTPEGDNAYAYLGAVLQQDPENETARAGIQRIVDIYITLAAKAVDSNELARAGRYLDRGLGIQPDNPELLALKGTIESRAAGTTVTPGTATATVPVSHAPPVLKSQRSLLKRRAADRRHDVNFSTGP